MITAVVPSFAVRSRAAPVARADEAAVDASPDGAADAALVRRIRAGDGRAPELLYRRHVRMIASIAQRLLRDRVEVDDVVQETFLIAFEQLGQLAEPEALRGWLARIAVSRVHRRFRWRRLTRLWSSDELAASLHEQAAPGATPDQRAELALIDRALGKLALALRVPWVLRHVLGYPLDEVATSCNCSLATVKRRIAEVDAIVLAFVGGAAVGATGRVRRARGTGGPL